MPRGKGGWTNAKEILTYEYLSSVHKHKTTFEIHEETGCGLSTIRGYLRKYGLSIKRTDEDPVSGRLTKSKNPNWGGGKFVRSGYVFVIVGHHKYRREHLVVVEKHIGRKLYTDECCHHLDGERTNNELENLCILIKREHDRYHLICRNKNIDYTKHTLSDILEILYPKIAKELKMYAELTRIGSVRTEG